MYQTITTITISDKIIKVLYGLSEINSVDVTNEIIYYFMTNNLIDVYTNVDSIIAKDPFPFYEKKLYIFCENHHIPYLICEHNNKLSENIIYNYNKKTSIILTEKIIKVLYGISEIENIDVTKEILNFFLKNNVLEMSLNLNIIVKKDPYPFIAKKLYIFCENQETIIINEQNNKLITNLIINKNMTSDKNLTSDNLNEQNLDNVNWLSYVSENIDLQYLNIYTKEKAIQHYRSYGHKEGRNIKVDQNKNLLFLLAHNLGGGLKQYVENILNIQDTNLTLNTFDIYYVSNPEIINLAENKDNRKIIVHINIFPNFLTISTIELNNFLNMLIKREYIKVIITIHDYFWLFRNNPSITHSEFKKYNSNNQEMCQKYFNRANLVIFPTEFLINSFKEKGITFDNVKYVIKDHPDIQYNVIDPYYPIIKNKLINIIFIGLFHTHKGSDLMIDLMQASEKFPIIYKNEVYNIVLHVVGDIYRVDSRYTSIKNNIKFYNRYNNENIFKIINNIQPNLIILPSIFEETWSYVLSICLKSGLPLFYNNIGAFKERIEKLKRTNVQYFDTLLEDKIVILQKLNKFIEIILNNESKEYVKINEEYKICSNSFYDTLYTDSIDYNSLYIKSVDDIVHKNLVIITCKIFINKSCGFNYINTRSIYEPEDRFKQTLKTIESVKKYIPDSFIILLDNSSFENNQDMFTILKNNVNILLNPTDNTSLNFDTNYSIFKQIGELSQIKYLLEYIDNTKISFLNLFKISARYEINEEFDYKKYDNEHNIFKKSHLLDRHYYYTSFYKIHISKYKKYKEIVFLTYYKCLTDSQYASKDLEVNLPVELNNDFNLLEKLGITQNIAVWNDTSRI